jgi:ABC-type sulfate transport system substrate-binding protein
MAAYGAQRRAKRTHKQAVAYLRQLYRHVVFQDKSACEALQTFLAGRGDVLLAYENEAIFARQKGQDAPSVIPKANPDRNPLALTEAGSSKPSAGAFVRFLRTRPAQRIFAENGYRPVLRSATKGFSFPVRPQLFTIDYLGGRKKVDSRFFHPRTGIVTKIQADVGSSCPSRQYRSSLLARDHAAPEPTLVLAKAETALAADECGLSLGAHDPEARQHHRKEH